MSQVIPGAPAAAAGVKSGDVITAINGTLVITTDELNHELAGLKPGEVATLTVSRDDGSTAQLKVTLGVLPGQ